MSQSDLDELVRNLNLTKGSSQLLGFRLREMKFLAEGTFSWYRHRELEFVKYFSKIDSLVFCNDLPGLFHQMDKKYNPADYILLIDSSKRSLKVVFLHNRNELASIPLAHSVQLTENYKNMKLMLHVLKYQEHNWLICCDLKVTALLLGLQGGYTKYPCFLCLWDSRADALHYKQKDWSKRASFSPGVIT